MDRYFLLAALSSDYLRQQIAAKTFSQDIISSLGDRLKDLLLPIPKDRKHIQRISAMVQKAIHESIEARELARRARKEVFRQSLLKIGNRLSAAGGERFSLDPANRSPLCFSFCRSS